MTWRELLRSPVALARLVIALTLSVTVATLITLSFVGFVTSQRLAGDAVRSRDNGAARASARITDLTHRNDVLQAAHVADVAVIAGLRQQLTDQRESPHG